MKVTCPICPILLKNIKDYVLNIGKIFSPEFIKNNYHKHLSYSLVLTYFTVLILLSYFHLNDTPVLFKLVVGGFGAFAVNWVREWYKAKQGNPFDIVDVHMGSYGGIIAAYLSNLTFNLIF